MNAKLNKLAAFALLALGCTSETEGPDPGSGGTAGASGTTGVSGTGGTTGGGAAGAGASGAAGALGGSAGASGTGGSSGGSVAGGTMSGGSSGSGGGAGTRAGSSGDGGRAGDAAGGTGPGGSSTGGTSFGGAGSGGLGGAAGLGGAGGASGAAGAGGSAGSLEVADALDGLRVDAPCTGTPVIADGEVCNNVELTSSGGFESAEEVTIGGTPGTTYDVTLRVRGVVEPTNIGGGVRADTSTFEYQGMTWRNVPLTVGGTVQAADYAQWQIDVESPEQTYFLNDYQKTGHYIFELDYEVTIAMDANTTVTLGATDSNEREIVNYEEYAPDGIPGSMNYGQFVQINVVSVAVHED
jgi:hypothetical protein